MPLNRYTPPVFVNDSPTGPYLDDAYFNALGAAVSASAGSDIATTPLAFTDWASRPNGQTVGTTHLADDGGTITVSRAAPGSQVLTVSNGRLEQSNIGTSGSAIYLNQTLPAKVNRIGASFSFGPGGANNAGSIALVAWDTATPVGTSNAHMHMSISADSWYLALVENGVVGNSIAAGTFTGGLPRDHRRLQAEMVVHGDVCTMVLPDGRSSTVRHSKIASIQGTTACWEYFNASGTVTPMAIYSMWADTRTSVPAAISIGDTGRLIERAVTVAVGGTYPPAAVG